MNVLFIGDVFGSPGRSIFSQAMPALREEYSPDIVIVNAENAAGGNGLTPEVAQELFSSGADVLTSGNHIWDKREVLPFLDDEKRVLRPINYPPGVPGRGAGVFQTRAGQPLGIINLAGRVYSPHLLDCPFRALDHEIPRMRQQTQAILIDFHAEATSEKIALAWYVDGRVSALFGTHTHVQTADERILPEGTAYITDAGMTGSVEGVIGVKKDIIIRHFLTQMPVRHEPAKGQCRLCGVFVSIASSGKATDIKRVTFTQ